MTCILVCVVKNIYVVMSHQQKAGRGHNLMIADKFSENVAKFIYLETQLQVKIAFTNK